VPNQRVKVLQNEQSEIAKLPQGENCFSSLRKEGKIPMRKIAPRADASSSPGVFPHFAGGRV